MAMLRQVGIEVKSLDQIRAMRVAGLVVASGLAQMAGRRTARRIDPVIWDEIGRPRPARRRRDRVIPGLPRLPGGDLRIGETTGSVHGIPSAREVLREGDLISIDFGAIVDGWHGDAAVTVAVGTVSDAAAALSAACEAALWDGLAAVQAGARLSDVSPTIEVSANRSGSYGIVTGYGGHGIGTSMHMDPHILNYGRPGKGPRLVPRHGTRDRTDADDRLARDQ